VRISHRSSSCTRRALSSDAERGALPRARFYAFPHVALASPRDEINSFSRRSRDFSPLGSRCTRRSVSRSRRERRECPEAEEAISRRVDATRPRRTVVIIAGMGIEVEPTAEATAGNRAQRKCAPRFALADPAVAFDSQWDPPRGILRIGAKLTGC